MAAINLVSHQNTIGALQIRRASISVVTPVIAGGTILSSHFNSTAGQTLVAATSISDSVSKIGHLWGVGYGDRGYGMTSPVLTAKSPGQSITSADWQTLRTTITNLITWQNNTIATIPASTVFDVNDPILAASSNSLAQVADVLDNQRLNHNLANMTLNPSAAVTTRTGPWGTFPISCSFTFELPSEDAMRYFFNSGGNIRLLFNHSNTSSALNIRWATLLNTLVIAFTANRTVLVSGARYPGLDKDIGYYDLTESWQTIYDGLDMSAYAPQANDILVEARSTFIGGLNGAKGRVIEFKVSINNDDAATIDDMIASGTSITLSHIRATTTIVIPNPTCTVTEPL